MSALNLRAGTVAQTIPEILQVTVGGGGEEVGVEEEGVAFVSPSNTKKNKTKTVFCLALETLRDVFLMTLEVC